MSSSRCEIQESISTSQIVDTMIVRVGMINLAILKLEDTQTRLLPTRAVLLRILRIGKFLQGLKVDFDRRDFFIETSMKVIVEVGTEAADPWKPPAILLLSVVDLLDWCARDDDESCVFLREMTQVWEVGCHESTSLAGVFIFGCEHVVIDDELGLVVEEILQLDLTIRTMEGVILRDENHWESLSLSSNCCGSEVIFFLFG